MVDCLPSSAAARPKTIMLPGCASATAEHRLSSDPTACGNKSKARALVVAIDARYLDFRNSACAALHGIAVCDIHIQITMGRSGSTNRSTHGRVRRSCGSETDAKTADGTRRPATSITRFLASAVEKTPCQTPSFCAQTATANSIGGTHEILVNLFWHRGGIGCMASLGLESDWVF